MTNDSMTTPADGLTAAPVAATDRFDAIDVLRGFAVLGILVLNIQSFAMIGAAYLNPTAYGDLEGANRTVWYFTHLLGDQKFMSIFSMLFGAGIVLMTSRTEAKGRSSVRVHYVRMAWLIGLGLLHAHGLWFGDILFHYGVCGMILFMVRRWRPAVLLGLSIVALLIGGGWTILWQASIPYMGTDVASGWRPDSGAITAELEAYRGGWLSQAPIRSVTAIFLETFLAVLSGFGWKIVSLMLLGMVLFKQGVLTASRSAKFYAIMSVLGLVIGLPVVAYGIYQLDAHDWSFEYGMFVGGLYNYYGSVAVCLGFVGLVMLVCRLAPRALVTRPLAAVGRMALTNYLMQTVICTTIFYGHGFGLFGKLERTEQLMVVLCVWLLQLVLSPIWLHYFRFGPAEWLWRSLTYARRQPLRQSR